MSTTKSISENDFIHSSHPTKRCGRKHSPFLADRGNGSAYPMLCSICHCHASEPGSSSFLVWGLPLRATFH